MFALICLSGRFISSFRNVFSYSAYMPPPLSPDISPPQTPYVGMERCVATKGAKLSSCLLPQSGYKLIEVILYL